MIGRGFGGWYPPGAANDPNAPWNQEDPPCEVCGLFPDDCLCPECPHCGGIGDPLCYDGAWHCNWCGTASDEKRRNCMTCNSEWHRKNIGIEIEHRWKPPHGLVRTQAQLASKAAAEAEWAAEAEQEALFNDSGLLNEAFGFLHDQVEQMSREERECWCSLASACPVELLYVSGGL